MGFFPLFLFFLGRACAGAGWLTIGKLILSLFLSTLETTIVSTSLISITNALNGFHEASWVVTSYMLTYTGRGFFFGFAVRRADSNNW